MSLLDCVGDLSIILMDAMATLGLVLLFILLPILPLFLGWVKILESRIRNSFKVAWSAGLFVTALMWMVIASHVLKCMGY